MSQKVILKVMNHLVKELYFKFALIDPPRNELKFWIRNMTIKKGRQIGTKLIPLEHVNNIS